MENVLTIDAIKTIDPLIPLSMKRREACLAVKNVPVTLTFRTPVVKQYQYIARHS